MAQEDDISFCVQFLKDLEKGRTVIGGIKL